MGRASSFSLPVGRNYITSVWVCGEPVSNRQGSPIKDSAAQIMLRTVDIIICGVGGFDDSLNKDAFNGHLCGDLYVWVSDQVILYSNDSQLKRYIYLHFYTQCKKFLKR